MSDKQNIIELIEADYAYLISLGYKKEDLSIAVPEDSSNDPQWYCIIISGTEKELIHRVLKYQ